MKQLAIISGKGGVGKTALTTAFSYIADNFVIADCNIYSPDIHQILNAENKKTIGYHGIKIATVEKQKCTMCKECKNYCYFNAIDDNINIINISCIGCGLCSEFCPEKAIHMKDIESILIYISETTNTKISYAKLENSEETFGDIIHIIKRKAQEASTDINSLIINDGPSDIGTNLTATITECNLLLIVTEPIKSSIKTIERITGFVKKFNIPLGICINQYDLDNIVTKQIEEYCEKNNLEILGKIPYDNKFIKGMIEGKNLAEYLNKKTLTQIVELWKNTCKKIQE